ncbi:hypothetical protein SAMN05444166_4561 [Singulisphaera sp. GP187]|nr:hypothetical protein SAMN05444166_4561 [Singulisphaera sp. GP187]
MGRSCVGEPGPRQAAREGYPTAERRLDETIRRAGRRIVGLLSERGGDGVKPPFQLDSWTIYPRSGLGLSQPV